METLSMKMKGKRTNYHKIYAFVQHIYNLLQSIHKLHVLALLGHHQALHMNRFLWF